MTAFCLGPCKQVAIVARFGVERQCKRRTFSDKIYGVLLHNDSGILVEPKEHWTFAIYDRCLYKDIGGTTSKSGKGIVATDVTICCCLKLIYSRDNVMRPSLIEISPDVSSPFSNFSNI
jgi:hypothetical protein